MILKFTMKTPAYTIELKNITISFLAVLCIWFCYYIDWFYFLNASDFGIKPREILGLKGILFSPFIHGNIEHLANNSVALFSLLNLMFIFYKTETLKVLFFGWIFSGFGTWLIATSGIHIGISGIIYVLSSYIFFTGLRTKYYPLMAISLLVALFYGGTIWYMFPEVEKNMSWQGHLSGFLSGFVLSFFVNRTTENPEFYKYDWQSPTFDSSKDKFMQQFDAYGNFSPRPILQKREDNFTYNLSFNKKLSGKISGIKLQSLTYNFVKNCPTSHRNI